MTFHLDENVNNAIAFGLRRHGIDVTVSGEVGLIEAEDEEQLAFALLQGRVIITQDEDMLVLDAQGIAHAGMCYWTMGTRSIGQIIRSLLKLHASMTADEIAGKVKYL